MQHEQATDHPPTTHGPPTDHRPTTDHHEGGNAATRQLAIDYDRCAIERHLSDRGVQGIASALIVTAAVSVRPVRQDGQLRLPWRVSERVAARLLGVSKSGFRHALTRLERAGLVTRGEGLVVVEWEAVLALPEPDPLADLPPAAVPHHRWSIGGPSLVGPLDPSNRSIDPTNHPIQSNLDPSADHRPTTDQPPTTERRRALPFVLRWRHLFGEDGRPNREGIVRLHNACVAIGWTSNRDLLAEFAQTLALVLWLNTRERRDAGVEHPIAWLITALRDGREKLLSWPSGDFFERAARMVRNAEGLAGQLHGTAPPADLPRVQFQSVKD